MPNPKTNPNPNPNPNRGCNFPRGQLSDCPPPTLKLTLTLTETPTLTGGQFSSRAVVRIPFDRIGNYSYLFQKQAASIENRNLIDIFLIRQTSFTTSNNTLRRDNDPFFRVLFVNFAAGKVSLLYMNILGTESVNSVSIDDQQHKLYPILFSRINNYF